MVIAQEEIFGPVLVIQPNDTETMRLRSPTTRSTASRAASTRPPRSEPRRSPGGFGPVRSEIDGAAFNPLAPFGGYKLSGHGRELGPYGIEEFLALKSMQL